MSNVLDELKVHQVAIRWREEGVDFTAQTTFDSIDKNLSSRLIQEAKVLHKQGLIVNRKLEELVSYREGNVKRWEALHKKLSKQLTESEALAQDEAFHLFVAWAGCHLRMESAKARMQKSKVTDDEKGGKYADITWSLRVIPGLQERLVSSSILQPEIHKQIMEIKK